MPQPDFDHISRPEAVTALLGSLVMGITRFFYLLRKGRKFKWFDLIAEPCFAIVAGMLVWLMAEATEMPDLMQLLLSQLGAWGGPKTIQALELRFLGKELQPPPQSEK